VKDTSLDGPNCPGTRDARAEEEESDSPQHKADVQTPSDEVNASSSFHLRSTFVGDGEERQCREIPESPISASNSSGSTDN
jgi:hypothetical protein